MKLTTYLHEGAARAGLVDGDTVIDLNAACPDLPSDLRSALRQGCDLHDAARRALASGVPRLPLATLALAPVLPEPGKIVCLGLNYYDHAREGGRDKPSYPWFFLRAASSLMGHGQPAQAPRASTHLDYEAELAVVIGTVVPRNVPRSQALSHVFGYACFNDISVRDFQKRTGQWTIGKNFDATGGFGPSLVTAEELPPGGTDLRIQCRLNGEVMQDANTRDMIWDVAESIALLSEAMTLEPGDVIAMGTPAGVGQSRTPPVWMREGDQVEIEIERIGTLRNPVRAQP
jgi:2-keto-4-pentenoate hydratase/2-oxohepta-3-ene-1,7-dioic acid hydratase in catechol pathway